MGKPHESGKKPRTKPTSDRGPNFIRSIAGPSCMTCCIQTPEKHGHRVACCAQTVGTRAGRAWSERSVKPIVAAGQTASLLADGITEVASRSLDSSHRLRFC